LLDSLLQEVKMTSNYKTRKPFDPVEHNISPDFRLTNYTKLKG